MHFGTICIDFNEPSVFGLLSEDFLTTINIISDVALGFIAFSIGNEFKMSYFKRVGVAPIVIACLESLFAVVFVVLGLLIARQPLPFSLVLGAIAAATAPAATIMFAKNGFCEFSHLAFSSYCSCILSCCIIAFISAMIVLLFYDRTFLSP